MGAGDRVSKEGAWQSLQLGTSLSATKDPWRPRRWTYL